MLHEQLVLIDDQHRMLNITESHTQSLCQVTHQRMLLAAMWALAVVSWSCTAFGLHLDWVWKFCDRAYGVADRPPTEAQGANAMRITFVVMIVSCYM